jgi:hypothetical protein
MSGTTMRTGGQQTECHMLGRSAAAAVASCSCKERGCNARFQVCNPQPRVTPLLLQHACTPLYLLPAQELDILCRALPRPGSGHSLITGAEPGRQHVHAGRCVSSIAFI